MRRRAASYRRPIRISLSWWMWALLLNFSGAGFLLFVVQNNHRDENHLEQPILETSAVSGPIVHTNRNFSKEMSSSKSYARQLAEQMTLAKVYVVIAKEHNNLRLAWELSSKIRRCHSVLSEAAKRDEPVSLEEAGPIVKSLSSSFSKAQDAHYDIATTIQRMKYRILELEEEESPSTVKNTLYGLLAAESVTKTLHCIEIRLTADWLQSRSMQVLAEESKNSPRFTDINLYHFCVFSDNLMAVSAVVNSTVSNAEHPKQLVFHIVTNGLTYGAIQAWFLSVDFKGAAIEVQCVEDFTWLNASYSPVVKQIRDAASRNLKFHSPKNLSLLNYLRFYIPEIYPQLEKVVFLEDDIVVQKDLVPLFSIDLHGNVNGAIETCLEPFHRYFNYLNFSNPLISTKFDPQACGWAFGMNVFDLISWRKANVTAKYHYWQEQNADQSLWKLGPLPPGLLAFHGMTEPLDRRWHVLGLGHDMNIDKRLIETAAVIHFNGNSKPWLRWSIDRYRPLWKRYAGSDHPYIRGCATS